jgi:hypothetical protein
MNHMEQKSQKQITDPAEGNCQTRINSIIVIQQRRNILRLFFLNQHGTGNKRVNKYNGLLY